MTPSQRTESVLSAERLPIDVFLERATNAIEKSAVQQRQIENRREPLPMLPNNGDVDAHYDGYIRLMKEFDGTKVRRCAWACPLRR
jgi:hypothetical protein